MPSNEIMSVEGQLCGIPLAGPESFSQQQLAYLKRALGVDETVLWESNISNGETSATLSESILNFEHVRIYYRAGERYGAWLSVDIMNRALTTNGIQLTDWFINSADTAMIMGVAKYSVSNDGLTLTGSQLHHLWFNLATFAYAGQGTAGVHIKKVVGIHRIAGGN